VSIPEQFRKEVEAFPPVLSALLEAEVAAGNEIVEVGHSFPAPPAGAYARLARPLITRERRSGDGIDYYDRNTSIYSGEITDAKRFYFLLEPPRPPGPEPDMNAIRARASGSAAEGEPPAPLVDRFRSSMIIDYEKWHDGVGYDVELLRSATPQELVEIEDLLVNRPVADWRDVEALAALDSPRARALLRKTLKSGTRELRVAVTDHAPHLVSEDERTATLVAALEGAEIYGGLTQALLQVEEFHPPKVIEALLRGALARSGDTAVHLAAMLMYVHGKAESSFDWEQRPFFLLFNTDDRAEREAAFRELCEKIGVEADRYLRRRRR
jgi:hypothetical protein